jgi:DNA ligase-1
MNISQYSQYLEKLDATTKRLEITAILAQLIDKLGTDETQNAVNLTLGQLYAPYKNLNFSIAEKMMIRALSVAYSLDQAKILENFKKSGDLGNTAQSFSVQKTSKLSVNETHQKLAEIALLQGTGSQDKKTEKLAALLKQLDSSSVKYVTRIVLGTTRLGFTALTIVDALSTLLANDKSKKAQIEAKYNIHPDIALIVQKIKKGGIKALDDITLEVGVPVLSQKPQRVEAVEEIFEKMALEEVWVEYKLDGTRVQFHFDRDKSSSETITDLFGQEVSNNVFTKAYTRNQDETSHQYPDLIQGLMDQIDAQSVILDGEAIGFDKSTGKFLDFQQTITRKRKHGVAETAEQIPLQYVVFDILYLNGKSLVELPLAERKQILSKVIKKGSVIVLNEHFTANTANHITDIFVQAKNHNLEGLVIKNPNKPYEAGARSFSWIKLKRIENDSIVQGAADSVDCVIMGYNIGKGARAEFGIGAFLAGIYDENTLTFKSVTKVGSGMTDESLEKLKKLCDKYKVLEKPKNYLVDKLLEQDVWVLPKIVVELRADEITVSPSHTAGYALRFPRLINMRPDKNAEQSTSLEELKNLYKMQKRVV